MNISPYLPYPTHVLKLRNHLAQLGTITPKKLVAVAGQTLVAYMIQEGMPDTDLTEELGLHWNRRDLARWMAAHPVLAELYAEGKRIRNPSGLCQEDYERNRLRKLGKLV
jgi:hypothetical protein